MRVVRNVENKRESEGLQWQQPCCHCSSCKCSSLAAIAAAASAARELGVEFE